MVRIKFAWKFDLKKNISVLLVKVVAETVRVRLLIKIWDTRSNRILFLFGSVRIEYRVLDFDLNHLGI